MSILLLSLLCAQSMTADESHGSVIFLALIKKMKKKKENIICRRCCWAMPFSSEKQRWGVTNRYSATHLKLKRSRLWLLASMAFGMVLIIYLPISRSNFGWVFGYIAITVDEIRAQRPIGTLPTSLTNNFPSSSAASRSPTIYFFFFSWWWWWWWWFRFESIGLRCLRFFQFLFYFDSPRTSHIQVDRLEFIFVSFFFPIHLKRVIIPIRSFQLR